MTLLSLARTSQISHRVQPDKQNRVEEKGCTSVQRRNTTALGQSSVLVYALLSAGEGRMHRSPLETWGPLRQCVCDG